MHRTVVETVVESKVLHQRFDCPNSKSLKGKMDASNPDATTAADYLGGTPSWRTDLYTGRGTLMTLRESIELNERNGVKHTPELKSGNPNRIRAVFGSQSQFAPR